jgi:ATP-dependent Clp protease ATP-binding subunit ClpX
MENTSYAILMSKKNLDMGIYYFTPITVIEGSIKEEDGLTIFSDKMDSDYFLIDNSEFTYSDEENGVWYIISEEELLNKYPNCSINEAKSAYLDDVLQFSHFGFYDGNNQRIEIKLVNFKDYLARLNAVNLTDEEDDLDIKMESEDNFEVNNSDNSELLNDQILGQFIGISIDDFKNIIDSKTYEEVMKKLNGIYSYVDAIISINENQFIKAFDDCYNTIITTKYISEMKNIIKKLEDYYIDLSLKLDELYGPENCLEDNEYLYRLIDVYDTILKSNDIEKIRRTIIDIQEASRENLLRISSSYQDNLKLKKQESDTTKKQEANNIINVKEMKAYFDQFIIGQEEAKKDVISSIVMNELSTDKYNKNGCFLVGPTGSGKTLIAEVTSKFLNKPMVIVDTTQITASGYIGANIEDFLVSLLAQANGNLKMAEEGIVVLDELDKKGSENNNDAAGRGVLNSFLPLIQGTTYKLTYNGRSVLFDTSKITFFATGAFTDVAKGKKQEKMSNGYGNNSIGFNSKIKNNEAGEDIKYEKLEKEDFVKYGQMPNELMGRFPTIVQLSGHTKESLKKILTESLISPLLSEQSKLLNLNIILTWDDGYTDEAASEALKIKTGARSLKDIVERTVKKARWEVFVNYPKYTEICLTRDTVHDNSNCVLIDESGNSILLGDILDEEETLKLTRNIKQ